MTDDVPKLPNRTLAAAAGLSPRSTLGDIAAGSGLSRLDALMNITHPTRGLIKGLSPAHGLFQDTKLNALTAAARGLTPEMTGLTAISRFGQIARGVEMGAFIRPELRALTGLSEAAAAIVRPFQGLTWSDAAWARRLDLGMRSIPAAWAAEGDAEGSAEAFARLSRFADVTRKARPYADETTLIVMDELGSVTASPEAIETEAEREARYDAAGREMALVAFPAPSYGEVLVAAGFSVVFPPAPVPAIEAGPDEPVSFNPRIRDILTSLEGHLRLFIAERLKDLEGHLWVKRRVPEAVRGRWGELRTASESLGRPVFPLIYYANFMDLAEIIVSRTNWDQAFGGAFLTKEAVSLSMARLYGLRNDMAHGRPTTISDDLIVMTEATFLFRALGLPVDYRRGDQG